MAILAYLPWPTVTVGTTTYLQSSLITMASCTLNQIVPSGCLFSTSMNTWLLPTGESPVSTTTKLIECSKCHGLKRVDSYCVCEGGPGFLAVAANDTSSLYAMLHDPTTTATTAVSIGQVPLTSVTCKMDGYKLVKNEKSGTYQLVRDTEKATIVREKRTLDKVLNQCTCDITDLMRYGCKCGQFKKESGNE
jgi:hypothetical protein